MFKMNSKHLQKLIIVFTVICLIAVIKIFSIDDYLSLSYIKASQRKLETLYMDNRATVLAGYMALYILVTSLSLPGATVMGLAAGALFGLLMGTVTVIFASTIGATLACVVSRFILRDWIQGKFVDQLKTVNEGIEKEGVFYLLTLRLIPVFPYWLINLVMGFTKMPLRTFYWVSLIGMLPGTIIYVNAGKELAKIESLSGIFSPMLILAFAILGVFPLIVNKMLALYKTSMDKQRNK